MVALVKMSKKDILTMLDEVEERGINVDILIGVMIKGKAMCRIDGSDESVKLLRRTLHNRQLMIDFHENTNDYTPSSEWRKKCAR